MNIKNRIKNFLIDDVSFIFSMPAILWQILFLYIPLIIVVYASLKFTNQSLWCEYTLSHYMVLFHVDYLRIIARSVAIASGVTLLCLFLAYPIAYFLALKVNHRWKN